MGAARRGGAIGEILTQGARGALAHRGEPERRGPPARTTGTSLPRSPCPGSSRPRHQSNLEVRMLGWALAVLIVATHPVGDLHPVESGLNEPDANAIAAASATAPQRKLMIYGARTIASIWAA
jgi:hypothetical protein